jgi:hypothetical protein
MAFKVLLNQLLHVSFTGFFGGVIFSSITVEGNFERKDWSSVNYKSP